MRFRTQKVNIPMCVAYVLFCLTMFSVSLSGNLYARYTAKDISQDSARVAVMAANASYMLDRELPVAPGESVEFTLDLVNSANGHVCEVTQNYSMFVESLTENMELDFEYFLLDGGEETKTELVSGTFYAGVEASVTCKVKITWTGVPQPASSAFEVDGIRVVIQAEQVD